MGGSRRGIRDVGRDKATGVMGNTGKEPGIWKAEVEELVKRKGGWVRGEDSVMEPELMGWPIPGEQGLRCMEQGVGWGTIDRQHRHRGEGKDRFWQGSEQMVGKLRPRKKGLLA